MSTKYMDCSGLVSAACRLSQKWTTGGGDIPGLTRIYPSTKSHEVFVSELKLGDVLVWSGHAAIYAEGGRLFHAHGIEGTPVGHTNDLFGYWMKDKGYPKVYRK